MPERSKDFSQNTDCDLLGRIRADVKTDRGVHPFKCTGVDSALLKFVVNPQHFAAASHHAEISEASFAQSRFQRITVKLIAAINQNNCVSRLPVPF